jgi:hypothetical protein
MDDDGYSHGGTVIHQADLKIPLRLLPCGRV